MPKTVKKYVFEVDGVKTLPLYALRGKTKQDIPAFSKGDVEVHPEDPAYMPPRYSANDLVSICNDPNQAIKLANKWRSHLSDFTYFTQLRDDPSRNLIRALHDHTRVLSDLCDTRLQVDPKELWQTFDALLPVEDVQSEYRKDPDKETKYEEYAAKLDEAYGRLSPLLQSSGRLIERILRQIEFKKTNWKLLPPIHHQVTVPPVAEKIELFYSYCHRDEQLRDALATHLSTLKNNGVIEGWHDRRITAGKEWEGQIDKHLESAHIILLLVSANFLASDYCHDVELKRTMERHEQGTAIVIPVILKSCDWHGAEFGKLQALPKDGLAVASWANQDEAFTDVAIGIRRVIQELRQEK